MSIAILPAHAQSYNILTQGFEDWYMPPIGWSTQIGTGYYEWWLTDYQWDMGVSPHSGSVMVYFDCYWAEEGWDAYLISPAIDLSLAGTCTVSFWLYRDATEWAQEYEDELEVYVNTSASPSGATKIGEVHRATNLSPAAAASGWTQYSFQINTNEFSGTGNYILFRAVGMRGNDLLMDDISIDATPLKPDAGIDEIIVTGGTFRESVQTLSAVVKNFGRMDLNHAEVHWSVSLNHTVLKPEEVLYWDGLLEPNKKDTITLGDFNFTYPPGTTSFSPFEVKAYTVYPNYDDEDNNPDNNLMIRGISPITEDAGAEIITRPAGGFIPGLQEVWARIRNYAPRPLKKLRINWSVDGVDKVPADWTGNLGFNQSEEINIGVHYFTFKQPIGAYLIHAETSMPNGFNDEFPDNDAVDTYIAPSLTPGTYYIGGSNYHFRTIAEAASYLNVGGVKGNGALNFVVRNGNYPDRVLVGDFVHQDNTIIFKSETGNPGDVTISPANEDDEDYLWKIDGADNIQIKSMTFNQDVFSGRHCIMLANGSNNISLNNLVMNGISGAPMDYDYALVYSVNNAGGGFNITNCSFNEGSAGIYEGTPATKSMIKVSKCEFYQ
ncbi:MAG TPA: hypothetical protein VHP30_01975, partial [Ignavibacteriales bacterium]|nr:hypothetical protein [Ignavibacteriales bacterium]